MSRPDLPPWMGLSPGDLDPEGAAAFPARLRPVFEAGLPALVLREPQLSSRAFLALAKACQALATACSAHLILHDAPHLVAPLGASGAHLGFRSLPPGRARGLLPPSAWLGLSTHAGDAWPSEEVNYCFYGPVFPTPSKAGWVDPVGAAGLQARVEEGRNSQAALVYALGGIDAQRAASVWEAGVHGIAVRGALWNERDPAQAFLRLAATGPKPSDPPPSQSPNLPPNTP